MIGRQEQERPMAVASLNPGYAGPTRDKLENFHGAQLIYVHWEEHLNFCAAITLPLPPETPFGALTSEILPRSEEHTSELQSLMRISYAVFCLTKKKIIPHHYTSQISKSALNTTYIIPTYSIFHFSNCHLITRP